jgi:hypothetical protein
MIFGAGYTSEPERKESRESDCRFLTRGNGHVQGVNVIGLDPEIKRVVKLSK